MDFKDVTKLMDEFVTGRGWYTAVSPKPQTPRNLAVSLMLEAAEVLEHFQWSEAIEDTDALASELADVALYLVQLAHVSHINLEQAILDKLTANQTRNW